MLIPSKLSRPVRLDHTVVRERLLAKLSGANNFRLALITSPAGYGKTTLVSQWAAGKTELGWYSLDEGDNQQERFASYLIAAISCWKSAANSWPSTIRKRNNFSIGVYPPRLKRLKAAGCAMTLLAGPQRYN